MAKDTPEPITLGGTDYPVALPELFAMREELVLAYVDASGRTGAVNRVRGATILLCCRPLLKEAGLDYSRARFDALNFGGAAYSFLREKKGATLAEVAAAGDALFLLLRANCFPTPEEIAETKVFSPPVAAG